MGKPIQKIEIELSSLCNAACPGCLRTILDSLDHPYEKLNLEVDLIKERLGDLNLDSVQVKLCGVLGDPMAHPEVYTLVEWLLQKKASVEISTNGGLGRSDNWQKLGVISRSTGRLRVHFSVDGLEDTNAIYRRKVEFERVQRNMEIYSKSGGLGAWVFIGFDHNSHQVPEAKQRASDLSFEFYVRRAIRNSFPNFSSEGQKTKASASKPSTVHENLEKARQIRAAQASQLRPDSILCKYKHQGEIFVSATGLVWPCCFLWDEFNQPKSVFKEDSLQWTGGVGWNDLKRHRFADIFNSPFFDKIEQLWVSESDHFMKRCFKSCGAKGTLQNSFSAS